MTVSSLGTSPVTAGGMPRRWRRRQHDPLPPNYEFARRTRDHTIVVAPEDRIIVVPPRTPDDYAVALLGGRRLWVSHPLTVQDVPGLLDILLREWMSDRLTTASRTCLSNNSHHQRKPRRPSLASVAKQARKAGLEVARYEVKPDNTVVVVIGEPESTALENPWLADLKVKQ